MGFLRHKVLGAIVLPHRETGHIRTCGRKRVRGGAAAVHVTEVESVGTRKIMIQAQSELVVILAEGLRGDESIFSNVGQREKRQDIGRRRIDGCEQRHLVERHLGPKKRELPVRVAAKACGLVESGIEACTLLREVALPFLRRRYGCRHRLTLPVAEAFVIPEEESLVLDNRPSKGGAELVLLQRLDASREVI